MKITHLKIPAVAFGLCVATPVFAASSDIVVESSASGGTSDTAKPYLDQFSAYAQKMLKGWKPIAIDFFTEHKPTDAAIATKKPGFGMLDIDEFLEVKRHEELVVLAAVEGPIFQLGHLHVVVKDPALKKLEDLKGKVVVSNHAGSPRFLSKVAFEGKIDVATFFTLQASPSPLRGFKAVDRDEAAATIVDDQQLANMKTLPFGASLRSIYDSPALPPTPFVAFAKTAQPEERVAMQKMLLGMCSDSKGGGTEVCKSLQITKFSKPDANVFNEAIKRFDK